MDSADKLGRLIDALRLHQEIYLKGPIGTDMSLNYTQDLDW